MRTLRLFSILDLLRSRRTPISAESLADTLNVSIRTIYRDMATLQEMGAPVRGEGGIGYQIEKGYFLPPIHFDPDEFDAFILGMKMIAARGDMPLANAALRAIGKINAVLPREKVNIQDQTLIAYSTQSETEDSTLYLSSLRAALRKREKLKITYLDLKEKSSTRIIRPLGLTAFDLVWMLTTWCEKRQDFRNFRVDRLRSVETIGVKFSREAGKEFKDYLDML